MLDRDEVVRATDMLSLVSRWATHPLRGPDRRGGYMTVCFLPGHTHKSFTASLSLSPEEGVFKCFGCGATGSTIDLYMLMQNVSFKDALTTLAHEAGISEDVPAAERARMEAARERERILTHAMQFYTTAFTAAPIAQKYMASRGIDADTCRRFHIGFSNGTLPKDLSHDELISVGLARSAGGRTYPAFRMAVVIPVMRGERCVYMTARAIAPKEGEKKHMHLPLPRGQYMPAWWNESALRATNMPVIAEAPIDALSWCAAGLDAVGIMGAQNFTERHLSRIPERSIPILALDSDSSGEAACERIGRFLLPHTREVPLVLTYPAGAKDANDVLVKEGKDALLSVFDTAESFPLWLFNRTFAPNLSLVKNIPAIRRTLAAVALCDPLSQEAFIMEIAERTHLSQDALKSQLLTFVLNSGQGTS